MSLHISQIVEIRRLDERGELHVGTGYLVDETTILTAAHAVDPEPGRNSFSPMSAPEKDLPVETVVRHSSADLAILKLAEENRRTGAITPALGLVGDDSDRLTPVETCGFPRVQRQPDKSRADEWVYGDLLPASTSRLPTLSMDVHSALPRRIAQTRSPWAGISGAPVFAHANYLTAVVVHDQSGFDGRWEVLPIAPAMPADEEFARAVPELWSAQAPTSLSDLSVHGIDDRVSIQISSPTEPIGALTRERLDRSPLELITARHALVPYVDRPELDDLVDKFLDSVGGFRVWLLHGPAGAGKSRLGNELYRIARSRGWTAGQVTTRSPGRDPELRITRPTLLIFDYAETQTITIDRLLTLISKLGATPNIRILLLARTEGAWLQALRRNLPYGQTIPDERIELGATQLDRNSRTEHYSTATDAFRYWLGRGADSAEQAPDLTGDFYGLPLLVHIRALLEVLGEADRSADNTSDILVDRLLDREWIRYWLPAFEDAQQLGWAVTPDAVGELVALEALVGPHDTDRLKELLRAATDLSESPDLMRGQLARKLADLYTGSIQPDLLGERLVARYLLDAGRLASVLARCTTPQAKARLLSVLLRMANSPVAHTAERTRSALRFLLEGALPGLIDDAIAAATDGATGSATTAAPLGRILAEALAVTPVQAVAATVVGKAIPPMPALIELAKRVSGQASAELLERGERAAAARVKIEATQLYVRSGDPMAALASARHGSDLTRGILASRPDLRPQLGAARSAQAVAELNLGHADEGRALAQEAVDLLRSEVGTRPEHISDLASALLALAWALFNPTDAGRATEAIDEAVDLQRDRVGRGENGAESALASVLLSRATMLQATQDFGRAHQDATEIVTLMEDRLARQPDTEAESILVTAESVVAGLCTMRDRPQESAEAARAAMVRATRLNEAAGRELSNLVAVAETAIALSAMADDRPDEAVSASRVATETFASLVATGQRQYAAPLLSSYILQAGALESADRVEEGIARLKQAVDLARDLAQENEGGYLPLVVMSLMMLAGRQREAGHDAEALDAAQRARDISGRLAVTRPASYTVIHAQALMMNADLVNESHPREADAQLNEAAEALQRLDSERSEVAASLLMTVHFMQTMHRLAHDWDDEALETIRATLPVARRIAKRFPGLRMLLVLSYDLLRLAHNAVGNIAQALGVWQDQVELLRGFRRDDPDDDEFREELGHRLDGLAKELRGSGLAAESADALAEAVQLFRTEGRTRPAAAGSGQHARGKHEISQVPDGLGSLRIKEIESSDHRVVLGRHHDALVAAAAHRPVLILGPQRSRKTTGVVIPTLLEWAGPAIVTSVRTDVIASTISHRIGTGRAQIFDPSGRLYEGSTVCQWDPLVDCHDWNGAVLTANWLTEAGAKRGGLRESEFWYNLASQLLAPLLHAAAIGNLRIGTVHEWAKSHESDHVEVILEDGDPAARAAFLGIQKMDGRARASVYSTLITTLSAYESEDVRNNPASPFSIDDFFDGDPNTLYLCAPPDEQHLFAPLFISVIRRVLQEAYRREAAGQRLNLLMLLDEAGNIAPLQNLDTLATTAAGTGIQLVTVFHDISQIIATYDVHQANTIANNHSALMVLPGNRDPVTADLVRNLLQDDPIQGGHDGASRALRRLRPGTALCFYEQLPPVVIELRSATHDADLRDVAKPVEDDPLGRWHRRRWRPAGKTFPAQASPDEATTQEIPESQEL